MDQTVDKPIGKSPFACRICKDVFIAWSAYKKHCKVNQP